MKKRIFLQRAAALLAAVLLAGAAGCSRDARATGGLSRPAAASEPAPSSVSQTAPSQTSAPAVSLTDSVPVLMYHSLQFDPANPNNSARIKAESFAAQMKWLHDNGYATLTLRQLYDGLMDQNGFPQKSVVLTFDDGYDDFYTNGFPIMSRYGFSATVFMITGEIGQPGYLSQSELPALIQSGMDIECHTVTHPYLDKLSFNAQLREMTDAENTLYAIGGHTIDYLAYPYGHYNADTIRADRVAGIRLAFKMDGGWVRVGDSPYELPRVYIGDSLSAFITKVTKVS